MTTGRETVCQQVSIFAIYFIYAMCHKILDHKDMIASHFDLFLLDAAHNSKHIIR